MCNQRGTTLIEILIVISIMAVVTSLILLTFDGTGKVQQLEQLIDQLQSDINWALQYADVHQNVVYLTILKDQHLYYLQVGETVLFKRNFNTRFLIEDNLNRHRLIIQANGTVANFGNLKIYDQNKLLATLYVEMYSGVIREVVH